ncbi:hypothetical protein [Acutalibacter caecimuris]|nr:hypothetical protein [Acutalibacter sp. M00118]
MAKAGLQGQVKFLPLPAGERLKKFADAPAMPGEYADNTAGWARPRRPLS